MHRCYTRINLTAIKNNYLQYKNLVGDRKIMAVVKADAYGHGAVEVSLALNSIGCDAFAVSNIDEAVQLREGGVKGHILIMGYTPTDNFSTLVKYDLAQSVISEEYAEQVINAGVKIKAHLAVDTGMHRFGIDGVDKENVLNVAKRLSNVADLCGLYTHLCVADDKTQVDFTKKQIEIFKSIAENDVFKNLPFIHCLNSAGGLTEFAFGNYVRTGIALYGLDPSDDCPLPKGFVPALTWISEVSMISRVKKGETVCYGRAFTAPCDMTLAVVSTGYADGYSRNLSNKGSVIINGKKAKVCGKVCMDVIIVDVSGCGAVKAGDKAELIGKGYTANDMAKDVGTINYEIVCGISKRVDREYIEQ